MQTPTIEILMATYNGERWLEDQIGSLLNQGWAGWTLHVQDDQSRDGTQRILETWAKRYPERIHYRINPTPSGPAANFSKLLQDRLREGSADYFLFCDQDDVWDKQHVQTLYLALLGLENRHGKETPCLAHADLEVCDRNLKTISPSFWEHQALDPAKNQLNRLLLQNVVTGCATGINRALAERAGPVPEQALMHDWWLALTAAAFGAIRPVRKPLVRYRIHGGNTCGTAARAFSWAHIRARLRRGGPGLRVLLQPYFAQAEAFLLRFENQLSTEQRRALHTFVSLPQQNWLKKRRNILHYGFWKQEWIRNLAWLVRA